MAKPYSNDLRQRVAAAIASGDSCRAIAEQYEIAPSTVAKWSKRLRETGSAAPAKFGGYRTCALEAHRDFLLARLEEVPHLTLHTLKDMLAARDGAQSEAPGQSRQGNWRRYSWTSGIPCVLLQATACLVGRLPTA